MTLEMKSWPSYYTAMKNIIKITLLSLLISGCWFNAQDEDTLYVLTSADYPPFEFYQQFGDSFELTGFDIELANRIAKHLGKKAEIHDIDFATIIPQIATKKEFIGISSISVTAERKQLIDYSIPYYFSNIGVLRHRHTNLDLIDSFEGILGVQIGASLEEIAETYRTTHPELKVRYYHKINDMINDLLAYKIDGILLEETPANAYEEAYKWLMFFKPLKETRLEYAIALPKRSKLKARINDIIKQLERSGVLTELHRKWFVARTRGLESEVSEVL